MSGARVLLVAAVAAALGVLVWSDDGRATARPAQVDRPPVATARVGSPGGQAWYCAAGRADSDPGPPAHAVLLTSLARRPVTVAVQPFGPDGAAAAVPVTVRPGEVGVVDVGATFGDPSRSVLVESPTGAVAVEHRLGNATSTDAEQVPCSTFSSGEWFFPAVTTTRDASALLTLFNPFPGDAGVDVQVLLDTGVRTPTALSGIVVPAGTARVVDLGETVQRRELFAAVVRARSGRVVAELAQSRDGSLGPRGLRLAPGVPAAQERWVLAGGFTGPGAAEVLVVQNPGRRRAQVTVQVTPYGGAAAPPEPLVVEVPAQRAVSVDLSAEARIPGEGFHSIVVDSPGLPVVAARLLSVSAAAPAPADAALVGRPAVAGGLAGSAGSPVAAPRWVVPSLDVVDPAPVVLVHNPGAGVALVTVSVRAPGGPTALQGLSEVEVQPGDSLAVPVDAARLGGSASGRVALDVVATEPVVVERLVTFGPSELSIGSAVPVRAGSSRLDRLGGG